MKLLTGFLAGLLLTGVLAIMPDTSFARGGGGGGHSGGFHGGFAGHGFASVGHEFHGQIARREGAWHHGRGRSHQWYPWYYGYPGPTDSGIDEFDGYADPAYDDSDTYDAQPAPTETTPQTSASVILSVQKVLARLGYYHGSIDGVIGSETEQAVRWFQSVDKLPMTGQIDSATLEALRIIS